MTRILTFGCAEVICPKCGGETAVQHQGGDDSARPEAFIRYCLECEWTDPE